MGPFPERCFYCFVVLKYWTLGIVQKLTDPKCATVPSESNTIEPYC